MIAIYKPRPKLIASNIPLFSMSTTLLVERFIIPVHGTNNRPSVFVAVKKYTPRLQSPLVPHSARNGISLVLTHGVTFRTYASLIIRILVPPFLTAVHRQRALGAHPHTTIRPPTSAR